jgi:hypothetical protein
MNIRHKQNGIFHGRLLEAAAAWMHQAHGRYIRTGQKQRLFAEIRYSARSWRYERRMIVKAEHNRRGSNPRFVVTNIAGEAGRLYDRLYCARGEAENRIKEQQLDLFSDRTGCMNRLPNQLRVLLSAVAYTLMKSLRRLGLHGTQMANARCQGIRLKLLKIGAVIIRNTRWVRLMLSSACPYQLVVYNGCGALAPCLEPIAADDIDAEALPTGQVLPK